MSVVEAQGDSGSRILFSFLERLVAQVRPQIFFSRTLEKLDSSAIHQCWVYLHQNAQTVYFIILYFHNIPIAVSQCVLVDLLNIVVQKPM